MEFLRKVNSEIIKGKSMENSNLIITLIPGSYKYLNVFKPLLSFLEYDNMKNLLEDIMNYYEMPRVSYNDFLAISCGKYGINFQQFQQVNSTLEEMTYIFKALSDGKIQELNQAFPSVRHLLNNSKAHVLR